MILRPGINQISWLIESVFKKNENICKHFDLSNVWDLLYSNNKSTITIKQYKLILYLIHSKKYFNSGNRVGLNQLLIQLKFKQKK